MVRLAMFLFVAQVVLAVCALISCLAADDGAVRALPRLVWVVVILIVPVFGSIAWFLAGRPVTAAGPGASWRPGAGFPDRDRSRPAAPDDDPEFIRSLGKGQAKRDRELFERWEEDLRRREDDGRRRDPAEPPRDENQPEG